MPKIPHRNNGYQERGSGARTPVGDRKPLNEGARAPQQPRPSKPPKR